MSILEAIAVLSCVCLAAHGLLLLNDGLYWDGWILDAWQRTRDWKTMHRFFSETGMPILHYQHRAMAALPCRLFAYKLLGFLSLLASAIFVFLIAHRIAFLRGEDALILAALVLVYPGQQMLVEPVISLNYMLPVALFLAASLVALESLAFDPLLAAPMQVAALVLFFVSFNMNSLLVLYWGFMAGLVAAAIHAGLHAAAWDWVRLVPFVVFAAWPFAYWMWKEHLTPRHGEYKDYNRLKLTRRQLRQGLRNLWNDGLWGVTAEALRIRSVAHALTVAACTAALTLMLFPMARPSGSLGSTLLGAGVITAFLAAVPYIVVGQPFTRSGWGTKNNILLCLPFSLINLGVGKLSGHEMALAVVVGTVGAASLIDLVRNHLKWMAITARHQAVLLHLAERRDVADASIVIIRDPDNLFAFAEGDQPVVYTTHMLANLCARTSHLVVVEATRSEFSPDEITAAIKATTIDYGLGDIDRNGQQVVVHVAANPTHPVSPTLGWMALVHRVARRRFRHSFLSSLCTITSKPGVTT